LAANPGQSPSRVKVDTGFYIEVKKRRSFARKLLFMRESEKRTLEALKNGGDPARPQRVCHL
jgi:hypothetical protein